MQHNPNEPVFKPADILAATKGTLFRERAESLIGGISTDTRHIAKGNLFIALKGEYFDGHDFILQAAAEGAAGVLVQRGEKLALCEMIPSCCSVIIVDDTLKALSDIAAFWRSRCGLPVVAVTGSSGKTTTKEMIAGIAALNMNIVKSEGNFNNIVGLSLSLLRIGLQHDAAVMELGTNRRGEIERLARIAQPDVALITNIGPAHLEGLHSLETVRDEKGDLWRVMGRRGAAVINNDDDYLRDLNGTWKGERISFGIRENADVKAEDIERSRLKGTSFRLKIGERSSTVALKVPGIHNVYNALAAAAACRVLGVPYDAIHEGLESFLPVPGRMDIQSLKNGAYLIDDTYNANPASTREALMTLKVLKGEARSTVILGDMLELGDHAGKMHRMIGGVLAETGVGRVFLKGRHASAVAAGAIAGGFESSRIVFAETEEEIYTALSSTLRKGEWILVKGSRGMKMELIICRLKELFGCDS